MRWSAWASPASARATSAIFRRAVRGECSSSSSGFPAGVRRILIHINNTNPILDELSVEFGELRQHGVEVAQDGMEISL